MDGIEVRRPGAHEQSAVQAFVQTIVDETYAFIWPAGAPSIDESDWAKGWIAIAGTDILGVMLSAREWLDDLWIDQARRSEGIGSMLLARAEREIAARGYAKAYLRVVEGNTHALEFYQKRGWCVEHRAPHARLPMTMITLSKDVKAG